MAEDYFKIYQDKDVNGVLVKFVDVDADLIYDHLLNFKVNPESAYDYFDNAGNWHDIMNQDMQEQGVENPAELDLNSFAYYKDLIVDEFIKRIETETKSLEVPVMENVEPLTLYDELPLIEELNVLEADEDITKPELVNVSPYKLEMLEIATDANVPETIKDELNDYAQGKFTHTAENSSRINLIAQQYDTLPIEIESNDSVDTTELSALLVELQETASNFVESSSQTGKSLIGNFKASIANALTAVQKPSEELSRTSVINTLSELEITSVALREWLTNNWYQFGGTPENDTKRSKVRPQSGALALLNQMF